jgi:hypothetical protein
VKTIDIGAFAHCYSLSKMIIEGELEFIGVDVFDKSYNIKEIKVCSENVKQLLLELDYIPEDCEIVVDETLNKNKNVNLGSDYLSDDSIDSSYDEDLKANVKKQKEKDDYIRGDEL